MLPADGMGIEIDLVGLAPDFAARFGVERQDALLAVNAIGDENPPSGDNGARPAGAQAACQTAVGGRSGQGRGKSSASRRALPTGPRHRGQSRSAGGAFASAAATRPIDAVVRPQMHAAKTASAVK